MRFTFNDYYDKRLLQEMAQSRGDPKADIDLDDKDEDFIQQVIEAGRRAGKEISRPAALRARYTTLLQDKPGESGTVRVMSPGRSKEKWLHLPIERTHLGHLQRKLQRAGLTRAAEQGFSPAKEKYHHLTPNDDDYYDRGFSRQNANDILGNKKPIDVNYGVSTGTKIRLKKPSAEIAARTELPDESPEQPGAAPMVGPKQDEPVRAGGGGRLAMTKPVPNTWATEFLRKMFAAKDQTSQQLGSDLIADLDHLPGKKGMYDFRSVWKAVETLVGDTHEDGKYILPEVWQEFQKRLPEIGHAIYDGVSSKLREFGGDTLENPMELRQAMMQTTAMILSDPLRGGRLGKKGQDFLSNVSQVFNDGSRVSLMASSLTAQGYVRKEMGQKTNNTRRREYGGSNQKFDAPDVSNLGHEDDNLSSPEMVQDELRGLEPRIEKIKAKLTRYGWDFDRLNDDEREAWEYYEGLRRKMGDAPATSSRQSLGVNAAKIAELERKIAELEPVAKKVDDIYNTGDYAQIQRISDDDQEAFGRWESLKKELEKMKDRPDLETDDINAPAAASHHFRRNESITLGFNEWCQHKKGWGRVR